MKCNRCQRGLEMFIGRKLGRCPRCMRLSALGALSSWTVSAGLYLVWPISVLLGFFLFSSAFFTLLWVGHLVARIVNANSIQSAAGRALQERSSMPRREFIPVVGRILALLGVFGFGALSRPRNVQAALLDEDAEGDAQLIEPATNGTIDECQTSFSVQGVGCSLVSEAKACDTALRAAKRAAERRCNRRNACGDLKCVVVKFEEVCRETHTVICCNAPVYVCCVTARVECGCA